MTAGEFWQLVQHFRESLSEDEEFDFDPDVVELVDLVHHAVRDTLRRSLPRPSVARLDYVAAKPDGPAEVYAMFRTWIDGWMNILKTVFPRIDNDQYWDFANKHVLDVALGANEHAGHMVYGLLFYAIDGDPTEDADEDLREFFAERGDKTLTAFEFFYEKIFREGGEFHNECALILLFMVKCAFFERAQALAGGQGAPKG